MEKLSPQQVNFEAFRCELNNFEVNEIENYEQKLIHFEELADFEKNDLACAIYNDTKKNPKERKLKAMRIWENLNSANSLLNLATAYFLHDENQRGYEILKKSANMGNKTAQLRIGYCLLMGIGVKPNLKQACTIFKKLAQDKIPDAVYFTGATYMLNEDFVTADKDKANKLLMWSLAHGCKFALFEHGMTLLTTKNDKKEALKYIMQAADKNEVRAMMWLAIESSRGTIIPADLEKSQKYLQNCCKLRFKPALNAVKEAMSDN